MMDFALLRVCLVFAIRVEIQIQSKKSKAKNSGNSYSNHFFDF